MLISELARESTPIFTTRFSSTGAKLNPSGIRHPGQVASVRLTGESQFVFGEGKNHDRK